MSCPDEDGDDDDDDDDGDDDDDDEAAVGRPPLLRNTFRLENRWWRSSHRC